MVEAVDRRHQAYPRTRVHRRRLDLVEVRPLPCAHRRREDDEAFGARRGLRVHDAHGAVDQRRRNMRGVERAAHRARDREHEHAVVTQPLFDGLPHLARRWGRRGDALVEARQELGQAEVTIAVGDPAEGQRQRHDGDVVPGGQVEG